MTHAPRTNEERALQIALEALEFYQEHLERLSIHVFELNGEMKVDVSPGYEGGAKALEALKTINEILKEEK